ncbi:transmembrane protein 62 isoform X2 [Orussus abietinus]|uniref:transmembrane protein 62 isoform X2 n=1 Tax=Orussus abietinus TaxID=222816 RepID=UPI000C7160BB|nr:transmembrane protein 62 isoform X2 [Orussus abietinus]
MNNLNLSEMRISMSALIFLVFTLVLSIFVANVADFIDVDTHAFDQASVPKRFHPEKSLRQRPEKYDVDDSFENIMWFLQISDIHISIFQDLSRITEFKEFCDVTVGTIQPYVVLASGDLTDAKTRDKMGSRQIIEEWQHYKNVLDETNIVKRTIWLDVRGNHDNFNIPHFDSKNNYYLNYSVQGKLHPRSYMHQITVDSEKYSFIAIDACLEPGPRRPFNFVGMLDRREIERIHQLANESKQTNGNFIIWFGHYPTSCILAQCNDGVRNILGNYKESMVYLCGHLHMLGGVVPNMYTLQYPGFLELELADWMDNRMYRLAAIDHGQFSFTDIKHRDWPVVLITNPKHALFMMPQKENVQSMIESTHVRVLAFSVAPVKSVEVQIDEGAWMQCRHAKGPLYVTAWNSSYYKSGIHRIQVRVLDEDGRKKVVFQPFSLDGSRLTFKILPRLILMSNVSHLFQSLFASVLLIMIVPLCVLRLLHFMYKGKRLRQPRVPIKVFQWWYRKLWILSTVDRLFFPLVLYALYLTIGPWAIGEVIENHVGVIFAWGIFVANSFLPGSFTYAYGFFQLFTFHLPLVLMLAHRIDRRLREIEKPPKKSPTFLQRLWSHVPFFALVALQISMVYFFWLAYGTIATVLCPLRTWSIFLAAWLWHQTHAMPQSCLSSYSVVVERASCT